MSASPAKGLPESLIRRRSVLLIGIAILAFLTALRPASAANSVRLQNRTFTPLRYKIKTETSVYSTWRVVRPGRSVRYTGRSKYFVKVKMHGSRTSSYTLTSSTMPNSII